MKKNTNQKSIKGITKKMSFTEILEKYPAAAEVLMEEGLHCIGCAMAAGETLEEGAKAHGINPDDLVGKINKKLG